MFFHAVYVRMFTHFRNNPIRGSYWQGNVPRTRGLARGSRWRTCVQRSCFPFNLLKRSRFHTRQPWQPSCPNVNTPHFSLPHLGPKIKRCESQLRYVEKSTLKPRVKICRTELENFWKKTPFYHLHYFTSVKSDRRYIDLRAIDKNDNFNFYRNPDDFHITIRDSNRLQSKSL